MKRIFTFLFGLVVGASGMYGGFSYHIVRATDGLHLIKKATATLAGSYADIRDYNLDDWKANPQLAVSISAAGKTHLLKENAMENIRRAGQQLWSDVQ